MEKNDPMNKKVIPVFVMLLAYASILPANDIDRTEVSNLQQQAKQQIEQCANVFSNQRINMISAFDSMAEIITTRLPKVCVQTGLDWYQRRLTELAVTQQELDDRMFRANLASLTSQSGAFLSDFGQSNRDAGGSVLEYNTFSSGKRSNETSEKIPVARGYTNLAGE